MRPRQIGKSRGTDDFRMRHQQLKDVVPLCCTHELAVSDARYVNMGWHDASPSHHWTRQRTPPGFINPCTCSVEFTSMAVDKDGINADRGSRWCWMQDCVQHGSKINDTQY